MNVSFATEPGSPDVPNEDWVGATANVVVVLDGVSTPPGFDTGCVHGTVWFVRQLGAWLLGLASTEPDVPLRDHLAASIRNVADTHATTCDTSHLGTPAATVAMLRERNDQVDWLVLSDAFVAIATSTGVQIHTDARLDYVAIAERVAMRGERIGTPQHDAARQAVVSAQRRMRNKANGYWVAGADLEAADHAITGSVLQSQVLDAAVLTDGAAVLTTDPDVEWADALEILGQHGPKALINSVRAMEAADPRGTRYPRFKANDDATVAHCILTSRQSLATY